MNVGEWYCGHGGTFFHCGYQDCPKKYKKAAAYRRHFRRKHLRDNPGKDS